MVTRKLWSIIYHCRLQNILEGLEGELKGEIQRNRGSFFEHKGINQETIENEIYKSPYLLGENAVKYG